MSTWPVKLVGSLDSFEGIPDVSSLPQSDEAALRYKWQKRIHRAVDSASDLAPGLLLTGAVAIIAGITAKSFGTSILGFSKSPISPILVTVLLGLIFRNTIGLPKKYRDGLSWCVKRLLRIGVALLGLRLSLGALSEIGLHAIPIVLGCIAAAIIGVIWLGKMAGLSGKLSTLIAVGTSICGVSAIVATGPAIKADDDEVSYSVAVITLFGMIALTTYPFLAHFLFAGNEVMAGLFLAPRFTTPRRLPGQDSCMKWLTALLKRSKSPRRQNSFAICASVWSFQLSQFSTAVSQETQAASPFQNGFPDSSSPFSPALYSVRSAILERRRLVFFQPRNGPLF